MLRALLLFAFDTHAGPWNGIKAYERDFILAVHANPIRAVIEPMNGLLNSSEKLGVGLLEGEPDVQVAFLAGLIDPVATFRSGLGSGGAGRRSAEQFVPLFLKNFAVSLKICGTHRL